MTFVGFLKKIVALLVPTSWFVLKGRHVDGVCVCMCWCVRACVCLFMQIEWEKEYPALTRRHFPWIPGPCLWKSSLYDHVYVWGHFGDGVSETHPGFPLLRSSEDFVVVRFYIVQAYTFSSTKIIFSGCIRNWQN